MSVLTNGLRILSVAQEWQIVVTGVDHHPRRLRRHSAPQARVRRRRLNRGGQEGSTRSKTARRRRNKRRNELVETTISGGTCHVERNGTSAWSLGALMAIGLSAGARADEAYIPLISKGFQHQFWQAVKPGAEQAAKDDNVKITFEGPETEAMVDKQIDMLSAALAKHPNAIGFAALDQQGGHPAAEEGAGREDPGHRLRLGRRQRHPADDLHDGQRGGRGPRRRQDGRDDRRLGRSRRHRARPDEPHRHRPARRLPQRDEGETSRTSRSSASSTAPATT